MRSHCLAFLVLFVALASGQDHTQPQSSDTPTDHASASSDNNHPSQVQNSAPHGPATTGREQQNTKQEAGHWLTHGEWVMSGLTFIYVVITLFYAITSHKTLKAIEDQGRHAKDEALARDRQFAQQLKVSQDAANAALLNAQALINTQRPWIAVRRKEPCVPDSFIFEAVCISGVPAKIVQNYAGFQAVDRGESLQPIYETEMLQISIHARYARWCEKDMGHQQ